MECLYNTQKLFITMRRQRILSVTILIVFIFECSTVMSQAALLNQDSLHIALTAQKQANIESAAKATIVRFVMKNEDGTYGYSIFIDGNMTYHQPNVPAVRGNKGFEKAAQAEACAKLAIQKIKEGESPPTLSVEEVNLIINN